MRYLMISFAIVSLLFSGCLHEPVHQGNRFDNKDIYLIKEGDTKFSIEQKIGTPSLNSTLHPNRVMYYEEYEDEESGDIRKRGIEITYDEALRAKNIRYFGFEDKE